MPQVSAGLLMYRIRSGRMEVFLVHPGGPYWQNKDQGAWMVPKGLVEPGEDRLAAAQREFREETGIAPRGPFLPLGQIRQKGGKIVHAWAFEGDCDPNAITSNTYSMEWPPKSGRFRTYPEVDRAAFFTIDQARHMILPSQAPLLNALEQAAKRGDISSPVDERRLDED